METESGSASRQSGLAQRLKEDSRQTIEQRKRSAADRIDEIAQAIGRAGAQFSDNEPTLAQYADRFSSSVGNLATRLRDGSLEDLLEDTRQLARRNPALFLAGGVALGFALSRFVKASAEGSEQDVQQEFSSAGAPTLTEEMMQDPAAAVELGGATSADVGTRGYGEGTAGRSNGG